MKFADIISPEDFDKHIFPLSDKDQTWDQARKIIPEMKPYLDVIQKHYKAGHIDREMNFQFSTAFMSLAIALEEIDGRIPTPVPPEAEPRPERTLVAEQHVRVVMDPAEFKLRNCTCHPNAKTVEDGLTALTVDMRARAHNVSEALAIAESYVNIMHSLYPDHETESEIQVVPPGSDLVQ